MFKLLRLEDRIVLDGAALDTLNQKEQYDQHEYDLMMQASQVSDHQATPDLADADHDGADADQNDVDTNEPLFLADITDSGDQDTGTHVLVISSDIKDGDDLAAAAKDDVLVIRYDAANTSTEELAKLIHDALGGQKADSIAFAVHSNGDNVNLHLTQTDVTTPDTLNDAGQVAFWQSVGGDLSDNGRVDLLACNVAADQTGIKFITDLETLTGKNVAASSDLTGNAAHGGNWTLETDQVDVKKVYFDDHRIEQFDSVLAGIGHGNRLIPNQSAVVGKSITTYELFPADTFTAGAVTDVITYSAPSPWTPAGRQLLIVNNALGNIKFNASSRQIYGLPSASLITSPDAFGSQNYQITINAKNTADNSPDSLTFTYRIGAAGQNVPVYNDPAPNIFYVDEGAAAGTIVTPPALITATDADNNLAASPYSIVWSSNNAIGSGYGVNNSPFTISNTGQITVAAGKTIDYAVSQYSLILEAKDSTGLQDTARVVINVNKVTPTANAWLTLDKTNFLENGGTATLTANLTATVNAPVTVNLGFEGSATYPTDFTAPVSINIPAGQSSGSITLTGINDAVSDEGETVIAKILSGANTAGNYTPVTATITEKVPPKVSLVSFNPSTFAENGGTTVLTAQLSASSATPVTVNLGFQSGTGYATLGTDFTANATVLTFPAGNTSQTITLTGKFDTIYPEGNETVVVNAASAVGADIDTAKATVTATVIDFDHTKLPAVSLSADRSYFFEGVEQVRVFATVTAPVTNDLYVHVSYPTTGGFAQFGSDYDVTPQSNYIKIASGQGGGEIVLSGINDGITEPDEPITVKIDQVTDAGKTQTLGKPGTPDSVSLSLKDNTLPTVSVVAGGATIMDELGYTVAPVYVNLSHANPQNQVYVYLSTAGGNATINTDYTAARDMGFSLAAQTDTAGYLVTFPVGSTQQMLVFKGLADGIYDGKVANETVVLTPFNAIGAVTTATSVTLEIKDADTSNMPALSMWLTNNNTMGENNSPTTLVLKLDQPVPTANVEVVIGVSDKANGVAYQGGDYTVQGATATTGNTFTVTIPQGSLTRGYVLSGSPDGFFELNETFNLSVNSITHAQVGTAAGPLTATIIDDTADIPTISMAFSNATFSETSGAANTTTLTLSLAGGGTIQPGDTKQIYLSQDNSLTNGATANGDYLITGATFNTAGYWTVDYTAPAASKSFAVNGVTDAYVEGTEVVKLFGNWGATGGTTYTSANLIDNTPDTGLKVSILGGGSFTEGSATTLTLALNQQMGNATTVNLAYGGAAVWGTATAGAATPNSASQDYMSGYTSSSVVFAQGETLKTITLTSFTDGAGKYYEGDETLTVSILTSGDYNIMPTAGAVSATIVDQYSAPAVYLASAGSSLKFAEGGTTSGAVAGSAMLQAVREYPAVAATVNLSYSTDSAIYGNDYTGVKSVVLADGATAQPFQVSSITDKILEPDETIVVTAVSVTGPLPEEPVGTPGSITLTIADDDLNGPAQLFVEYPGFSAATIGESVTPNTTTIKLNLDRQLNTATTVTLGIDGSAKFTTGDYSVSVGDSLVSVGTDGKLVVTFSPSDTQKTLTFKALNDGVYETATETIKISIGNVLASGTNTVERADATTYTAVIVTDGGNAPRISMHTTGATLAEDGGTATVLLTLNQGMQDPVTVNFGYDYNSITTPGAVKNPQYLNDFLFSGDNLPSFSSPNTFQVVIPPNTTQIALNMLGQGDTLYEGDEIVKLTLGSVTYAGGSLTPEAGKSTANLIIADYDDKPTASLVTSGAVTMMEDPASNTAGFTIALNESSTIDTTINLTFSTTTSPGNAILSSTGDYTALAGTQPMTAGNNFVVITAGGTAGFVITASTDTLVEGNETFQVRLGESSGYSLNTTPSAQAQNYTIIDNDFTMPSVKLVDNVVDTKYGGASTNLNENGGFNSTGVIYVDLNTAAGLSPTLVAEAKITLSGLASYIDDYTVNVYESGGFTPRPESVTDGIISVFFANSTTTRAAVVLTPKADAIYEGDESLTMGIDVTASQNLVAGTPLSSTLTVIDAQTAPKVSLIASAATLSESTKDGSYPLTSTVSLNLSGPMAETFTVGVSLTPTSDTLYPKDFVVYDTAGASIGTLSTLTNGMVFTIPAGQTSTSLFAVTTKDDLDYESNQSMTAYLMTMGSTGSLAITAYTAPDTTTANTATISIAESDTGMKPYVSISLNSAEGYGNGSWTSTTGIPYNFGESGGFTIGGTGGTNDGLMGIDVTLKNAMSQGTKIGTSVVVTLGLGPVYTAGSSIYATAGTAGATNTMADYVVIVGTDGMQAAIMQDPGTTNTGDEWWKMVVTLPSLVSKGTVYLSALDDTIFEAPELIVVNMVTASGATPVTGAALTATLLDDDQANAPGITLGFAATSFSEGGFTQLYATLGDTSGALVDTYVKIDFTNGTANWNGAVTSGGDFSISGTAGNYIKFTPGQSISYIQLNGLTDGYLENTESVIASIGKVYYGLSDTTGYAMNSSTGNVLIDGDGPAKVTLSTPTVGNIAEVTTGVTTGYSSTMLVNLNYSADYDITVNLSFTSGTASYGATAGGGDFLYATSGATNASPTGSWDSSGALGTNGITIPAGQTAVKLWLSAFNDTRYEGDETLVVTALTGASYTATASPAQTVTITDNEKLTIALNPGTFSFDEGGVSIAQLTMGLFSDTNGTVQSLYSPQTVVLQFSTDGQTSLTSGTANKASFADYQVSIDGGSNFSTVGADGKLPVVLPTGASQQGIVVRGVDDAYFEGTEGFTVSIATSGSYNVSAGADTVSGTVLDNDPQVYIKLAQTPANGRISEGGGLYAGWLDAYLVNSDGQTVGASVDTPLIIAFTAASYNNQAQLNVDYTAQGVDTSGYITTSIPVGQSSTQVYLSPGEDTVYEGPEAFSAFISNRMYADVSAGDGVRTFTILDNDPGPTVSLAMAPPFTMPENAGSNSSDYLAFNLSMSYSSPQTEYVYLDLGGKAMFGAYPNETAGASYGYDYFVGNESQDMLMDTVSVNGTPKLMLSIPAGSTQANYYIYSYDDASVGGSWAGLYEGNETFTVSLSTYSNGGYLSNLQTGTAASVTGTIIDDDTPPRTLSLASLGTTSFAEATTDTNIFWLSFNTSSFDTNVTLSLGGNATLATDGTASEAGEDYQLRLGTEAGAFTSGFTTPMAITSSNGVFNFTIPSSATLTGIPIYVSMYQDRLFEVNETFTVTINQGMGYSVGTPGVFNGTILDDDQPKISLYVDHTASDRVVENSYAYDWRPEQTVTTGDKVLATATTDNLVHIYSYTNASPITIGNAWNTTEAARWSDGGVWSNTLGSLGKNFVYEMDGTDIRSLDGLYKITKDVATTDMVLVDWTLDFTAMNAAGFTAPSDYLAGKTAGTVTLAQDAGVTAVIPLNITIIGDDKAETNTSGTKLEDIAVKISNARWFNGGAFTSAHLQADYGTFDTTTAASATSHLYVVDDDFYPGQSIGSTVGVVDSLNIRFYNPLNEIASEPAINGLGTSGLTEGGVASIGSTNLYFQDVDQLAADTNAPIFGKQNFGGLTYTVVTAPSVGTLFVDANSNGVVDTGEALSAGSTFLQSAITSGQLKYTHGGSETVTDSFTFTVSDGMNVTYATAGTGNKATFGATAGSPFTFAITAAGKNDPPAVYNKVFWINENTDGSLYKDASLGQIGSFFAFDSDDSNTSPEYNDFAQNTAAQVYTTAKTMGETAGSSVTGSYIVYDPANWYKDTAGVDQPLFALETAFANGQSATNGGTKLAIKVANTAGLDYEVKSAYSVHVKVNDTGTTTGQTDAWVVVKVNDLPEVDPYAINNTPLKNQAIDKAYLVATEQAFIYQFDSAAFPKGAEGAIVTYRYASNVPGGTPWLHFETESRTFWSLSNEVASVGAGTYRITVYADYYYQQGGTATLKGTVSKDFYMTVASLELDAVMDALQYLDTDGTDMLPADGDQIPVQEMMVARGNAADANAEVSEVLALLDAEAYLFDAQQA